MIGQSAPCINTEMQIIAALRKFQEEKFLVLVAEGMEGNPEKEWLS